MTARDIAGFSLTPEDTRAMLIAEMTPVLQALEDFRQQVKRIGVGDDAADRMCETLLDVLLWQSGGGR